MKPKMNIMSKNDTSSMFRKSKSSNNRELRLWRRSKIAEIASSSLRMICSLGCQTPKYVLDPIKQS